MLTRGLQQGNLAADSVLQLNDYPAAATAGVITLAAVAQRRYVVQSIRWSYSDLPTGGRLTVKSGTNVIVDFSITAGGPGFDSIPTFCAVNEALEIRLYSGAGTIAGRLNAQVTIEA